MEEVQHIIEVLESAKIALAENDSAKLKEISDKTIHSASVQQDSASINLAVIIYSLGKIIERKDKSKAKDWNLFLKKFNSLLSIAITSLLERKFENYEKYISMARKSLISISPNMKAIVEEVLKKASINKASKIYEHGVSIGQTANLLGLSQWELLEYTSQKDTDQKGGKLSVKARVQLAVDFFS